MAHPICLSPSTIHHIHRSSAGDSIPRLPSRIDLPPSRAALQDRISQESLNPSSSQSLQTSYRNQVRGSSSPRRHVWVNPASSKAVQLRKRPDGSRYASLESVAGALSSCNPTEDDVSRVLTALEDDPSEQEAVIVINNMTNHVTAPLVLKYFQKKLKLNREAVLYNVTFKVFRKCRNLAAADKLFDEMLQRGVQPDNITFSTIISCARQCFLPNKAVELFEKMPLYGCEPDVITYSAVIDAYGRLGSINKALSLYDRARTEKWSIDAVTFSTVIKIHAASGNVDGSLNVFEEMKAVGVKPNLAIYNTLLDATGKCRRISRVSFLYKEMINNGILPNRATYCSLTRAYSRARYGVEAIALYRQMKEKDLELDLLLYNTLLSMCADIGYVNEAIEIFEDLKSTNTFKPDKWTYSSMISVHSSSGDVIKANGILNEMMEAKVEPDIFVLTSLIQCYGKANRIDDVVKTFDRVLALGIEPDDRLSGCLLSVLSQTQKDQLGKLVPCIELANAKLGLVVKLLLEEKMDGVSFESEARSLLDSITSDAQKAYCNSLIDLCVNLNHLECACVLLELGIALLIYTNTQSKSCERWSLHLKSLSLGAALTALHIWVNDLSKAVENGEELPSVLGINTGHGKHKQVKRRLAVLLETRLRELNAPFVEAPDMAGWFLATKDEALTWLESRKPLELAVPQV